MMPTNKVAFGAIAGAITIILMWVLRTYGGKEMTAEVSQAVTVVITFIVQYLVPDKSPPQPPVLPPGDP